MTLTGCSLRRSTRRFAWRPSSPPAINIYASVDGIVCILQNALIKFCPSIKVNCSRDNEKHKPWLMNEIKSRIKKKLNKLHIKYFRKPLSYGHQYRAIRSRLDKMKKGVKKIIL